MKGHSEKIKINKFDRKNVVRNRRNFSANMRQPCKRSLGGREASITPGISGDSEFLDGGPVSTGTHHS